MNILSRYSLQIVLPIYIISLLLFVLALELVEIVTNLIRYIQLSVPLTDILQIQFYFLPSALHFALPIAMLFSVSFSIGTLHGNSELLAIFAAGYSLTRFTAPLIAFAAVISVFSFFLQDIFVTNAQRNYNQAKEAILLTNRSEDNEYVAVFGPDGRDVYFADFFNASTDTLDNVIIVERDLNGDIYRRINAERAMWTGEYWQLFSAYSYVWDAQPIQVTAEFLGDVDAENFNIEPGRFAQSLLTIDELNISDAREYIALRYESGLPYREALTAYYRRFSFAFTPLIVAIVSCGIGGLLRRNTFLLSMILSLCTTVVYYVMNLLTDIFVVSGYISPLIGAWTSVVVFFTIGSTILLRYIRT